MDDKKETTEEKTPEIAISNIGEGSKYETTPVIERAREEREKLEKATEAQKIENDRTEQIMAKRALGGTSEAGAAAPVVKEETPQEYAKKVIAGDYNG